jgi:hypothetical protein
VEGGGDADGIPGGVGVSYISAVVVVASATASAPSVAAPTVTSPAVAAVCSPGNCAALSVEIPGASSGAVALASDIPVAAAALAGNTWQLGFRLAQDGPSDSDGAGKGLPSAADDEMDLATGPAKARRAVADADAEDGDGEPGPGQPREEWTIRRGGGASQPLERAGQAERGGGYGEERLCCGRCVAAGTTAIFTSAAGPAAW